MPFQCELCDLSLPRKSILRYHIASKHHDLNCDICFIGFSTNSDLQVHVKAHDGKEPYRCDLCDTRIITQEDLMRHASSVHVGNKNNEEKHS